MSKIPSHKILLRGSSGRTVRFASGSPTKHRVRFHLANEIMFSFPTRHLIYIGKTEFP